MSKLSLDRFVALVERSRLIAADELSRTLESWKSRAALAELDDAQYCADHLVDLGLLTSWQCKKLIEGRHRGFFLGKYKLLDHLGSGGMSNVYLAEHVLMQRRVAVKVLPQNRVGEGSYLARFHLEAQAAAALDHPNIVRAYDLDDDGKIHYFVMEYVEGRDLYATVRQDGPLDFHTAANYTAQAARGLEHAHAAGLVHRDIKPANLLVDLKGTVKILDLGLAKFAAKSSAVADSEQDHVLGTADYLAPEQVVDSQAVDHRADIYALGGTLYYLLSGHPPFAHGTTLERLTAHQQQLPPSLLLDRPDAPAELVAICRRMLEKSPASRFQTAAEVARELNAWLDNEAQAGRWRPQELMAAASARTGNSSAAHRPSATREAESHINLISGSATDLHRAAGEALSPVPSLTDTDPNLQRKTVRIPTSRPQLLGQRQPGGPTSDVFVAPSAPAPAEYLPAEAAAKAPLSLVDETQSENWEGHTTLVTSAINPFAPRVGEIDERRVLRMHRASARSANWLWVVIISGLVLAALALAISALPS